MMQVRTVSGSFWLKSELLRKKFDTVYWFWRHLGQSYICSRINVVTVESCLAHCELTTNNTVRNVPKHNISGAKYRLSKALPKQFLQHTIDQCYNGDNVRK